MYLKMWFHLSSSPFADDLEESGAFLTMSSFLCDQEQFTEEKVHSTHGTWIAAVRVHVERAVRKVKEFEVSLSQTPRDMANQFELPVVLTFSQHLRVRNLMTDVTGLQNYIADRTQSDTVHFAYLASLFSCSLN